MISRRPIGRLTQSEGYPSNSLIELSGNDTYVVPPHCPKVYSSLEEGQDPSALEVTDSNGVYTPETQYKPQSTTPKPAKKYYTHWGGTHWLAAWIPKPAV